MKPDRINRLADKVICDCCAEAVVSTIVHEVQKWIKNYTVKLAQEWVLHNMHNKRRNRIRPIPFGLWYRQQEPFVKRIKRQLKKHWGWERTQVISNLKKLGKSIGYRIKVDIDIDVALFPRAQAKKKLTDEMARALAAILVYFGEEEVARLNLGTAFNLDNPHVQKWIKNYTVKLAQEIEAETLDRLMATLREGISNGETIPDLTRRVRNIFGDMEKWRAERIARTESLRAANKGALEAYRQSGVVQKKVWIAADDACDFCGALDGQVVDLEENYYDLGDTVTMVAVEGGKEHSMSIDYTDIEEPPLHANCLLPGTRCETPSLIIAGLRAWYSGETVELALSNGERLTVTPNHMLLTPHGFAPAYLLCQGDDVICRSKFEGVITADPNNDGQPALIEEIISAFTETPGMVSRSVPVSAEDLHGDGRFCNSDVNIIYTNRFLQSIHEPALAQPTGQKKLTAANAELPNFPSAGALNFLLQRMSAAADGIVGGHRQPAAFFLGRLGHSGEHSHATSPGRNSGLDKPSPNDRPRNAKLYGNPKFGDPAPVETAGQGVIYLNAVGQEGPSLSAGVNSGFSKSGPQNGAASAETLSDLIHTHAGLIETVQIIGIKNFPFHGYVYDIQTDTSLYIANSVLSSNCRCAISGWIED